MSNKRIRKKFFKRWGCQSYAEFKMFASVANEISVAYEEMREKVFEDMNFFNVMNVVRDDVPATLE